MIITDYNRCKGCKHYTAVTRATASCFEECQRKPYTESNILRFTARGKFGSIEYRLDLRGITTMMNSGDQNRLIKEIQEADRPLVLYTQWLKYVEWLYEHEREVTPAPILRRMSTLREKLILVGRRAALDAAK